MWGTVEILFTVPGQLCPRCVLCVACGKVGVGTVSLSALYLWVPGPGALGRGTPLKPWRRSACQKHLVQTLVVRCLRVRLPGGYKTSKPTCGDPVTSLSTLFLFTLRFSLLKLPMSKVRILNPRHHGNMLRTRSVRSGLAPSRCASRLKEFGIE